MASLTQLISGGVETADGASQVSFLCKGSGSEGGGDGLSVRS